MKKYVIILLILGFLFLADHAQAVQVYFDPPPVSYRVGDEFALSLYLNTEGQSINAVEINITVPQLLRIKNISKNGSSIQLWVQEPSFKGNKITLTGGIPGGLENSKALLVKITFIAAAVGEGNIAFSDGSSVLLNDGQGTQLGLTTTGGPYFSVVPRPRGAEPQATATPEVEEEKIDDKRKPDKFKILIGQDPRVLGGKPFASFFTTDAESGVDHYEIKIGKEPFKIANSPYLLEDLAPRTVIKVKAFDGAGNDRQSVYPGIFRRIWWWIYGVFS